MSDQPSQSKRRSSSSADTAGRTQESVYSSNVDDIGPLVGKNVRAFRQARGLTLEQLANGSGLSRPMSNQNEYARSAPTINVLWKITRALDGPFSKLLHEDAQKDGFVLRRRSGKTLASDEGAFRSRALFPTNRSGTVELYQIEIGSKKTEVGEPPPPGTIENIVVNQGGVCITVQDEVHALYAGDAFHFRADTAHTYKNAGDSPALLYSVISHGNAHASPLDVPVAK